METVYIIPGYHGVPKIGVRINDKEYVLENQYIKDLLEKLISERGYQIKKTKRQKYPRLIINI